MDRLWPWLRLRRGTTATRGRGGREGRATRGKLALVAVAGRGRSLKEALSGCGLTERAGERATETRSISERGSFHFLIHKRASNRHQPSASRPRPLRLGYAVRSSELSVSGVGRVSIPPSNSKKGCFISAQIGFKFHILTHRPISTPHWHTRRLPINDF